MLFHTRFLDAYRSHNRGATYFGKFIFTTDVNEVEITPTTIVVRRGTDNSTQVGRLGVELWLFDRWAWGCCCSSEGALI